MVDATVCFEREVPIEDASMDEVTGFCDEALKGMRLRIEKEESTRDGKTTIFASEGALVPFMLKALLFPSSLGEYVKRAQRSGLHVLISPSEDGIHLYSLGLALARALLEDWLSTRRTRSLRKSRTRWKAWISKTNSLERFWHTFPRQNK